MPNSGCHCYAVEELRASTFLSASPAMDRSGDGARGTVFILCLKSRGRALLLSEDLGSSRVMKLGTSAKVRLFRWAMPPNKL